MAHCRIAVLLIIQGKRILDYGNKTIYFKKLRL